MNQENRKVQRGEGGNRKQVREQAIYQEQQVDETTASIRESS